MSSTKSRPLTAREQDFSTGRPSRRNSGSSPVNLEKMLKDTASRTDWMLCTYCQTGSRLGQSTWKLTSVMNNTEIETSLHLPLPATLRPFGSTVAPGWCGHRSPRASRGRCACGSSRCSTTAAELALDERQSCLAIHGAVALVHVGVVAGAAVWIRAVAIALDLACRLFDVNVTNL